MSAGAYSAPPTQTPRLVSRGPLRGRRGMKGREGRIRRRENGEGRGKGELGE